jgi:hypothetical protein
VRYNGGGVVACLFGRDQESIHDIVLKCVRSRNGEIVGALLVSKFGDSIDLRKREVIVSLKCADLG